MWLFYGFIEVYGLTTILHSLRS